MNLNRQNGQCSAEVCIGQTRSLAIVSGEVIPPFPDRPAEGFLTIHAVCVVLVYLVRIAVSVSFICW